MLWALSLKSSNGLHLYLGFPLHLTRLSIYAGAVGHWSCSDSCCMLLWQTQKKRRVQRIIHDTTMINIYIDRFIRALRPTRHSYVRLIISWSETIGFIAKWSFKTMLCDLPGFSKHLGGKNGWTWSTWSTWPHWGSHKDVSFLKPSPSSGTSGLNTRGRFCWQSADRFGNSVRVDGRFLLDE